MDGDAAGIKGLLAVVRLVVDEDVVAGLVVGAETRVIRDQCKAPQVGQRGLAGVLSAPRDKGDLRVAPEFGQDGMDVRVEEPGFTAVEVVANKLRQALGRYAEALERRVLVAGGVREVGVVEDDAVAAADEVGEAVPPVEQDAVAVDPDAQGPHQFHPRWWAASSKAWKSPGASSITAFQTSGATRLS